jgi:hypothetical protein
MMGKSTEPDKADEKPEDKKNVVEPSKQVPPNRGRTFGAPGVEKRG